MTDRHDSPPLTRRELRERERANLLAGRDPSWQAPPDSPAKQKVQPAGTSHDVRSTEAPSTEVRSTEAPSTDVRSNDAPSTADEQSIRGEQQFEPKAASSASDSDAPSLIPFGYQNAQSLPPAQAEAESPFAPMAHSPQSARSSQQPTNDAERTLTRRQLRERRASQGQAAPADSLFADSAAQPILAEAESGSAESESAERAAGAWPIRRAANGRARSIRPTYFSPADRALVDRGEAGGAAEL